MRQVDLRSDTVAHPTPQMWAAMSNAEVGDDFYGEDPTVNQLQERVASLLGKEKALFLPSGTMSNLVAIAAHTHPGQEVICDYDSHIFNSEIGVSRWLGIQFHPLQGHCGLIDADRIKAAIRHSDNLQKLQTGLIILENPHNRGGGTIYALNELQSIRDVAQHYSIPMHLDGARLLNAVIASGIAADKISDYFDSVYFCLSKGLGCPIGSVLAGSNEFITNAIDLRLALGGGMCQVGMLAAAGIWALEHHIERLSEDHRRARELAVQLSNLAIFSTNVETIQTNIVLLDILPDSINAVDVVSKLQNYGIKASIFGHRRLRLVTHLEIDDEAVDYTVCVFKILSQQFER
ncbi:L-allo-threonine aldolase [Hyella patelloides LEGE 07179]|uniref:L-allo-threonine aldolase n=1 Tax=Hyella patelloides LEGE 07179 TaxID=945734 RepID=A0A563VV81_9CYAN|nr:GntG family PLP-dependent aldolase [Hyella patelloides]VEP15342.1 L-allo-threonine aldolase [Hyella patelloides LEGE 07179]